MPCRPSTSTSRTFRPPSARPSASAAATLVFPVPPLPVTTCKRAGQREVRCWSPILRLYVRAAAAGELRAGAASAGFAAVAPALNSAVTRRTPRSGATPFSSAGDFADEPSGLADGGERERLFGGFLVFGRHRELY